MTQQPLLALHATGIAGQGTVASDDAMAGNDNANGIRAIGGPHRTRGACAAQLLRELAVMHDLPAGNGPQRLPHFTLERGASRGGGECIDDAEIALEVRRKLIAQPTRIGARIRSKPCAR